MRAHHRLRSALKSAARRITFLAIVLALTRPGLAQSYTITDLGTLGGTSSRAYDINNARQITGNAAEEESPCSVNAAFLWEDGEMINIGSLGGPCDGAIGRGINDRGEITGWGPGTGGIVMRSAGRMDE